VIALIAAWLAQDPIADFVKRAKERDARIQSIVIPFTVTQWGERRFEGVWCRDGARQAIRSRGVHSTWDGSTGRVLATGDLRATVSRSKPAVFLAMEQCPMHWGLDWGEIHPGAAVTGREPVSGRMCFRVECHNRQYWIDPETALVWKSLLAKPMHEVLVEEAKLVGGVWIPTRGLWRGSTYQTVFEVDVPNVRVNEPVDPTLIQILQPEATGGEPDVPLPPPTRPRLPWPAAGLAGFFLLAIALATLFSGRRAA